MSGVAKKRTTSLEQRRVGRIKLRRVQNEDYQIDSSSNLNNSMNWQNSLSTPNFDLFEDVLQSASQPSEKPNSHGFVIQSVTSLNPKYDIDIVDLEDSKSYSAPLNQAASQRPESNVINVDNNSVESSDNFLLRKALLGQNPSLRGPRKPVASTNVLLMLDADDGGKYFPCRLCEFAFIHKSLLVRHMQTSHSDFIVCKLCASFFASKDKFNGHLACHRTSLPPSMVTKCPLCLRVLIGKNTIGRHMEVHSVARKHQCEVCKHRFKRPDHLKVHRQNVHGLPPLNSEI